jgi:hypothetical protein
MLDTSLVVQELQLSELCCNGWLCLDPAVFLWLGGALSRAFDTIAECVHSLQSFGTMSNFFGKRRRRDRKGMLLGMGNIVSPSELEVLLKVH